MAGVSHLLLASGSPRRQDLLRAAGIPFTVEIPDLDEWDRRTHPTLTPAAIVSANAERKARCVAARHPRAVILAADTTVVCAGRCMGKPADREDAAAMLRFLSGKTHAVLTGVAWLNPADRDCKIRVARTRVTFRALDAATISDYLAKVNVMDKAGAYGYQEHGEMIVEKTEGSVTNIIGLPMELVMEWWTASNPSNHPC
ncbi:MAG: Maf family protein [Verrucomicrobiales bacterium]|jgi:septum formation protein|nr:Maf family protein [Verrucomicrobiales bacterium]